jgi:excisionase family DNA binding protein
MDERLLLRAEEVATLLGVGRSKVWEMIWSGELPAIRMGRLVRVPRSRLDEWIASRSANAPGGDGVRLVG